MPRKLKAGAIISLAAHHRPRTPQEERLGREAYADSHRYQDMLAHPENYLHRSEVMALLRRYRGRVALQTARGGDEFYRRKAERREVLVRHALRPGALLNWKEAGIITGYSDRNLRWLVKEKGIETRGKGHQRKILAESLLTWCPVENPESSGQKRQ